MIEVWSQDGQRKLGDLAIEVRGMSSLKLPVFDPNSPPSDGKVESAVLGYVELKKEPFYPDYPKVVYRWLLKGDDEKAKLLECHTAFRPSPEQAGDRKANQDSMLRAACTFVATVAGQTLQLGFHGVMWDLEADGFLLLTVVGSNKTHRRVLDLQFVAQSEADHQKNIANQILSSMVEEDREAGQQAGPELIMANGTESGAQSTDPS